MRPRLTDKIFLLLGAGFCAATLYALPAHADNTTPNATTQDAAGGTDTIDEIFGNDNVQEQDARIPPVDEYNDVASGVLLDNPKKKEKPKEENPDKIYETSTHRLNYDAIIDLYNKGDYKTVAENLLPLAKIGHHGAEELMGIMFHQGQGVPQDFAKAMTYLKRAADADRPLSEHHLATMYYLGQGVDKDPVKALMWLHIAIVHYPDGPAKKRAEQDRDNIYSELSRRDKDRAMSMARAWLTDKGEGHLLDLQ